MAKNASGAAFLNSKKRAEEMALAQETGMELHQPEQDKFNMQHHHLLNCLENTTVSIYSRAGQVKYETSSLAKLPGEYHCEYIFSGRTS